jgi:hypothetical protein
MPQYAKMQERSLDNEARGYIAMIQAAEKVYNVESRTFFASNDHTKLNDTLQISLPLGNSKWAYSAIVSGSPPNDTLCAQAKRNGFDNRYWHMMDSGTDSIQPVSGKCP